MSIEFPFLNWNEAFSDLREARETLQNRLFFGDFTDLISARRRVLAYGYEIPFGRENIWGIGFGFKDFPPDDYWTLAKFLRKVMPLRASTYEEQIMEILRKLRPDRCIKVFVGRKAKPEEVKKNFLVGSAMRTLGYPDVKTDVIEIGQFRPVSNRKFVQPGCSGGNATLPGGTIGKIVNQGGHDVLLSCAHVFVNFTNLDAKEIIQPSSRNGGRSPKDLVGTMSSYAELDFCGGWNDIDAAIASIDSEATVNHQIPGALGPVSHDVRDPRTFEYVWKVGAATLDTRGIVASGAIDLQGIPYFWGFANFRNVHAVSPYIRFFPPPPFSTSGDSGSVVVSGQTGEVLGLIFADSPRYYHTLICSSVEVACQLKISF